MYFEDEPLWEKSQTFINNIFHKTPTLPRCGSLRQTKWCRAISNPVMSVMLCLFLCLSCCPAYQTYPVEAGRQFSRGIALSPKKLVSWFGKSFVFVHRRFWWGIASPNSVSHCCLAAVGRNASSPEVPTRTTGRPLYLWLNQPETVCLGWEKPQQTPRKKWQYNKL